MDQLPTVATGNTQKKSKHGAYTAPLFDKKSIDSNSGLELLTIPEVAELLKISAVGVRRLQQQRQMPFIKVGGSVRFAMSDIVAFLAKHRVEAIG